MAEKHRSTAIAAHEAGICVLYPSQDGSKAPFDGRPWKQFQSQRPTREQVEAWYADDGRTGVGFVGGEVSGGLELFEFEGRAVERDIPKRFLDLADQRGLSDLVNRVFCGYLEESPSTGLHLLYRCAETGCEKLAKTADGKDLIETKGEGGFMIVAPSNGKVHETGGAYRMKAGGIDTIPTITPEERRALLDLAAEFDERPPPTEEQPTSAGTRAPTGGDGWLPQVIEDFNRRTTWNEILAGRFTHIFDRGSVSYWHYVGAENHISATTNAKGTDTLIVFSGTAQGAGWRIWEGGRNHPAPSYDRFSTHVLLERGSHDTDTRVQVARELRRSGYGPPAERDDLSWVQFPQTSTAVVPIDEAAFWDASDQLRHIHRWAQAKMMSPWAVWGTIAARIVCQVPTTVVLPAIIGDIASVNIAFIFVGESGDGKGGATAVARRAVDIGSEQFVTHTLGTGQAIAHGYGHYERGKDGNPGGVVRDAQSVLFTVEEVDHLAAHAKQNASTTLPELRRFLMGEPLGTFYVDPAKRIQIKANDYRGAFLVSVQPARAGVLLNDVDAGTPQRFPWMPTWDYNPPDIEPELPDKPWRWRLPPSSDLPTPDPLADGRRPIPVCQTAVDAVIQARRDRRDRKGNPLDGHRRLLQERMAFGGIALLHGRYEISEWDWELAGVAMAVSDATRADVINKLEAKERSLNAARALQEADRDEIKDDRQDQRIAQRLKSFLKRANDWVNSAELRRSLAGRDRVAYESAVAKLIAAGQVESEEIEGPGQRPGTRYRVVNE